MFVRTARMDEVSAAALAATSV